jgi:hypothetical protein
VRLLGVGVSGLEPARQMDLFTSEVQRSSSQVQELIKEVRQRYGSNALRKGPALKGKRQT